MPYILQHKVTPEKFLQIGEYQATSEDCVLACRGLGSCVGLFLYDRLSKVAGGAHIMLPKAMDYSGVARLGTYAQEAVNLVIGEMENLGANTSTLRAKLVGGANVLNSDHLHIGQRNLKTVKKILLERGVYLAAEDTGGATGKSAFFFTQDGRLYVTAGPEKYYI